MVSHYNVNGLKIGVKIYVFMFYFLLNEFILIISTAGLNVFFVELYIIYVTEEI